MATLPTPTVTLTAAVDMPTVSVDQRVWVPGTDTTVWDIATVTATDESHVSVSLAVDGSVQRISRSLVLPMNLHVVDDMTALSYIHEAAILHNLAERAKPLGPGGEGGQQRPYTAMADVLIAVNPLRELPHPCVARIVADVASGVPHPHPFTVAERAYQQMAFNVKCTGQPVNQSVVISGESGAGKTESAKIVLRHLLLRGLCGTTATHDQLEAMAANQSDSGTHGSSLEARLHEQNPILEAFGNAKTVRNHNSSRFGKFLKLQFDQGKSFTLSGALIETYLLEKSRVVHQAAGERSFHIFYQLLAGASTTMKSDLLLGAAHEYSYLNHSGSRVAENTVDRDNFAAVIEAFRCVGVDDVVRHDLFAVLAGLLHLGNVEFREEDTVEGNVAVVSGKSAGKALEAAAKLLGVAPDALSLVITQRAIRTGGEIVSVRQTRQQAVYARDAMAKALYGGVFDFVIAAINSSLEKQAAPLPFIGVLDIFGFESFASNDFEQLLINYTSEVLQVTFNRQVFGSEMALFKSEGIAVGNVQWSDNRGCMQLIAGGPDSILTLLDGEAMTTKPSDAKFLAQVHGRHARNPYLPAPHKKNVRDQFVVRHFAGNVTYSTGQFVAKNNDSIPNAMAALFITSDNARVSSLFHGLVPDAARPGKPKSVAAKFSRQLTTLVATLEATRCSFIRCVKPHPSMEVGAFDARFVVDQLRYQGIQQTAQVLQVGLPTRVPYHELVTRFTANMPRAVKDRFAKQSDATLISAILWALKVPSDAYKMGITRLFFKSGKIALLDAILTVDWASGGSHVVARMSRWLAYRRWRAVLAKTVALYRFTLLLRKVRASHDRAATYIQRWWRRQCAQRQLARTARAATIVSAVYRGHVARLRFRAVRREARLAAEINLVIVAEQEKIQRFADQAASFKQRMEQKSAADMDTGSKPDQETEMLALVNAQTLAARLEYEQDVAVKRTIVSRHLLDGFAPVVIADSAAGKVAIVEVPSDMPAEITVEVRRLNEALLSNGIEQSEYDERVQVLLARPIDGALMAQLEAQQKREYTMDVFGFHVPCLSCGITNHTRNGFKCLRCHALLTTPRGDQSLLTAPAGSFSVDSDAHITIHDGYFEMRLQQVYTEAPASDDPEDAAFVLRCKWQPKSGGEPLVWLVVRFTLLVWQLHDDIARMIPASVATLPQCPFDQSYFNSTSRSPLPTVDRVIKYLIELLECCARFPDDLAVPALDKFLDLSPRVAKYRRRSPAVTHGTSTSIQWNGAEALAARELENALQSSPPSSLDHDELKQTERAVSMLIASARDSSGDLDGNPNVTHHLRVCVQLTPRVVLTADTNSLFADAALVPRAIKCFEDLEMAMTLLE